MKNYIVALIICSVLFSCKKKESAVASAPTNTANPAESTINGLPAKTDSVNGVFLATKSIFSSPYLLCEADAGLYKVGLPLQVINSGPYNLTGQNYGGILKVNNNILSYDSVFVSSIQNVYNDTATSRNYSNGVIWQMACNNTFPGFNLNVTRGFPQMINDNIFPQSFSKTQNLTINFGVNNISNTDSISLFLLGQFFGVGKTVPSSTGSITFTPSDLSVLGVSTSENHFTMVLKNYSNAIISKKTYIFEMISNFNVIVSVTP